MLEEAILEIARNRSTGALAELCAGFSPSDWQQFVGLSRSLKIAPEAAHVLLPIAPEKAGKLLKSVIATNSMRVREHLAVLKRITACAEAEGLRFVVVKGLSNATTCRGDLFARQAGDIDILVDSTDLARCDYVLRKAELRQPSSLPSSKTVEYAPSQAEQFLFGPQRPYPTRPKVHSDQLHPYYAGDMLVKVEVHDGLHYIPQEIIPKLLWMTTQTKMGPLYARTLRESALLLVLLASAFENSENIHSRFDGGANLRDYVDLRCFFERFDNAELYEETAELIAECQLAKECEQVLSNYRDLFAGSQTPLDAFFSPHGKLAHTPFSERVFDKDAVRDAVIAEVRTSIRSIVDSKKLGDAVVDGKWDPLANDFSIPLEYRVSIAGKSLSLSWRLPLGLGDELDYLAFQFGLIPKARTVPFETLVTIAFIDSRPLCWWQDSNRPGQKLAKFQENRELECTRTDGGSFIAVGTKIDIKLLDIDTASLQEGLGVIPMAFQRDTASEYRAVNLGEECYLMPLSLVCSNTKETE